MKALTLGSQRILLFFRRPIRLPLPLAKTHWHVIGISGSGKSNFLAWLFLEYQRLGIPTTLFDPHADLSRLVLSSLISRGFFRTPDAYEKLVYLNLPLAEVHDRYVPFNVFKHGVERTRPEPPDVVAGNVLDAMQRAWPSLLDAPRFDNLIEHAVPVLVMNNLPLAALPKLIAEKPFRDTCLAVVTEPHLLDFWHGWYDRLIPRMQLEYADSTLSRIHILTSSPLLRNSLSFPTNVLDWRTVMDQGKSVIVNLAVANPKAKRLLGCLLMVEAEVGAKSRADTLEGQRGPEHMLIVDEAPKVLSTDETSASTMLSETRKYGLHLLLANQNYMQLSEGLQSALQNTKVKLIFQQGKDDAERSARLLGRIDLTKIKHEVPDPERAELMHPVFESILEQQEELTQYIADQRTGWVTAHLPPNRTHLWEFWKSWKARTLHLRTYAVPEPQVTRVQLDAIEAEYLHRYFLPPPTVALPPQMRVSADLVPRRRRVA